MAKKRQGRAAPARAVAGTGVAASLAIGVVCLVLAGTALAVDTGAGAAFDSPKRLIAVLGTALAAACLLAGIRWPEPGSFRQLPRLSRASVLLACAALALAAVSALASPRRSIALDLARELGRTPNASEVVKRYEDYLLDRDPTPIAVDAVPALREPSTVEGMVRPLAAPIGIPLHYLGKLLGADDPVEADAPEDAQ